jgi:membrane protease YdiL (CAAX protease family)
LFPILLAYSRGKEAVRNAPEARPRRWSLASIAVNAGSWVIYLFAYELCMRGYLLFSLQRVMGSWPGIAVMTAVYTAVHLPKGKGEAAGSAVMGLVFGVLTVAARSIFPSLLIHACVSITVDMLVILRNRGEPQQP